MNKAQSQHVEMSLSPWHIWPKELPGTALFVDAPSRIAVPSHRPSLPLLSLPACFPPSCVFSSPNPAMRAALLL